MRELLSNCYYYTLKTFSKFSNYAGMQISKLSPDNSYRKEVLSSFKERIIIKKYISPSSELLFNNSNTINDGNAFEVFSFFQFSAFALNQN